MIIFKFIIRKYKNEFFLLPSLKVFITVGTLKMPLPELSYIFSFARSYLLTSCVIYEMWINVNKSFKKSFDKKVGKCIVKVSTRVLFYSFPFNKLFSQWERDRGSSHTFLTFWKVESGLLCAIFGYFLNRWGNMRLSTIFYWK